MLSIHWRTVVVLPYPRGATKATSWREREAPWSSPVFPYLGWIILGWVLTVLAVELNVLQRLLDTTSLTGDQWLVVIGLSLVAPVVVAVDKYVQITRERKANKEAIAARSDVAAGA